jgi:COP9 signalosome complex subunit 3
VHGKPLLEWILLVHVTCRTDAIDQDNNLGLVTQVVDAFFSQTVIKLGKTFAALTVADLAKQVFPSPVDEEIAESAVSSLIMSGALNATLVQMQDHAGLSMLRFSIALSFPRLSHELDVQTHLRQERQLMESLVCNLEETNYNLGMSDECVDSLQRGQAWSASGGANPTTAEEAGLEMDEDLMGDMS